MPPSAAVRRRAFAAFVVRALRLAEEDRGWSVPDVAREAGIGHATIYRWRDAVGDALPVAEQVLRFCDALDINPGAAFAILWPGKNDRPNPPEPPPLDRDFERVLRKLRDPNVSEAEKVSIRATVRFLGGDRAANPASQ